MLSNVTYLLLIIIVIVSIMVTINSLVIKKKNRVRYQQGLHWLKALRHLFVSVQQHRGLTMGYINGDKKLLSRITPLKRDINHQVNAFNSHPEWDNDNLIWQGLVDHWSRLSVNYEDYESKYNFTQHSNLIVNMLNLIEDSAENHHLQELICSNERYANFLWGDLLDVAEHVGQARAVGTSIAAAKASTSVERIKLNYLQNCIKKFVTHKTSQLDTDLIQSLLHRINKDVLIEVPSISAEDYFNLATEVLDQILDQFDNYIEELNTQYS